MTLCLFLLQCVEEPQNALLLATLNVSTDFFFKTETQLNSLSYGRS